ncbi:MAG: sarcosine oxidase subunit delta [Pararhodobacter sp.]
MRIPCPCCGLRDRREFTYYGAEDYLHRPPAEAPPAAWDDYLHNRDNPAGLTRDLWYHDPCGSWIVVRRNTLTHVISGAEPVGGVA